ncbi:MAG TPA: hypothetical protein VGC77_15295 [Rhodopseudomonas sp.]|uniref:hypothetical protein n=1 Tax=Rhodopseudomonas sp. TaxID=1078 RepID=UPI002ED8C7F9
MPSPARIERIKLIANFCNTIAAALLTVGVFTPIALQVYGFGDPPRHSDLLVAVPVVCLCACVALHLLGQWALEALDDPDDQ